MLKIYVYGYVNQIQSSQCLERETARNPDGPADAGFQDDRRFSQGQRPGDPLRLPAIRRAVEA